MLLFLQCSGEGVPIVLSGECESTSPNLVRVHGCSWRQRCLTTVLRSSSQSSY